MFKHLTLLLGHAVTCSHAPILTEAPVCVPNSQRCTSLGVHKALKGEARLGFRCRCKARVPDIPSSCHICNLTLVSSPHLARSYHHLFPVKPFVELSPLVLQKDMQVHGVLSEQTDVSTAVSGSLRLVLSVFEV